MRFKVRQIIWFGLCTGDGNGHDDGEGDGDGEYNNTQCIYHPLYLLDPHHPYACLTDMPSACLPTWIDALDAVLVHTHLPTSHSLDHPLVFQSLSVSSTWVRDGLSGRPPTLSHLCGVLFPPFI